MAMTVMQVGCMGMGMGQAGMMVRMRVRVPGSRILVVEVMKIVNMAVLVV